HRRSRTGNHLRRSALPGSGAEHRRAERRGRMSAPSRMPSLSYSCLVIRSFRSIARKSESLAPFVRDSSLSSSRNGSEVLQGTLRFRAAAQGAAYVVAHPAGGRAVGTRRCDGLVGLLVPAPCTLNLC